MTKFSMGAGMVVAEDVRATVAAFDGALLSGARMCVSVLEATQDSGLPAAQTQKLLRSISTGLNAVVDGRGEIVAAVRQMTVIKSRSNLAPVDYGCPDGWDAIGPTAPIGSIAMQSA